jgi:hypothetical protein
VVAVVVAEAVMEGVDVKVEAAVGELDAVAPVDNDTEAVIEGEGVFVPDDVCVAVDVADEVDVVVADAVVADAVIVAVEVRVDEGVVVAGGVADGDAVTGTTKAPKYAYVAGASDSSVYVDVTVS